MDDDLILDEYEEFIILDFKHMLEYEGGNNWLILLSEMSQGNSYLNYSSQCWIEMKKLIIHHKERVISYLGKFEYDEELNEINKYILKCSVKD